MRSRLKTLLGNGVVGDRSTLRQQLMRGLAGNAGVSIAGHVLALLSGITLARLLGVEGYGQYVFLLSVVTLIGLPTKAGLPTLIVRETAKAQLTETFGRLRGLLRAANVYVAGYSAVAAAIAWVFVSLWMPVDSEARSVLLMALPLLPLVALGNVRAATLRGLRRVVVGQLPEQIVRPTIVILFAMPALVVGASVSVTRAMLYTVIAAGVGFMFGALLLRRELPRAVSSAEPTFELRSWSRALLPLSLLTGLKLFEAQVSILILGTLGSTADVGLFRVAASGAGVLAIGLGIFNGVLAPYVTRLYAAGEHQRLERILTTGTSILLLSTCIPLVVLIVAGRPLIHATFGAEFTASWLAMVVLAIGQVVNVGAGSVILLLNMAGFEQESLRGMVFSLLLKLGLSLSLIPIWGALGCALAASTSMIVLNIYLARRAFVRTGIRTVASPRVLLTLWDR